MENKRNHKFVVGLIIALIAAMTACGVFFGKFMWKKKFVKVEGDDSFTEDINFEE